MLWHGRRSRIRIARIDKKRYIDSCWKHGRRGLRGWLHQCAVVRDFSIHGEWETMAQLDASAPRRNLASDMIDAAALSIHRETLPLKCASDESFIIEGRSQDRDHFD
jgi:hypothetical protein